MNIEEEIAQDLSNQIAKSIDFELITDMLLACGWKRVELNFLTIDNSTEILNWCKTNLKHRYQYLDNVFIFENQGEAVNFTLRWS